MPMIGSMYRTLCLGAAAGLLFGGSAVAADCAVQAKLAEQAYDIPSGLVQAIAQVESGHNPWAVAVGSKTLVRNDREQAIRVVRSRPAKGSFVGCMQLSVKHHEWAFDDKLDMLDPVQNVDYAAQLLVELQEATGTWSKAVQRYQGGKPAAQRAYLCKIAAKLRGIDPKSPALGEMTGCDPKGLKAAVQAAGATRPALPPREEPLVDF
jgi:hypothetical protein